jgi:glycosyltransferase involved in cell wall biosynthesis
LLRLIAQADCYVSLHRSEGFGYTMAEAMYYGVPVIASGYSGNLEYMTEVNSLLVPCREVFVKNAEGPFQHGSVWGEPDVDAAAAFMREVVERPDEALARGERGRQSVIEKLSAATVAETLRSSLRGPEPVQRAAGRPSRV